MSRVGRRATLAVLLASCARDRPEASSTGAEVAATNGVVASATASVPRGDASATVTSSACVLIAEPVDADEASLRAATLVNLVPQHGPGVRAGVYEAVIDTPGGRRSATAEPALARAPTAHRGPLAFYRLARALGMRVVPVTALRSIGVAELGAALEREPTARALLREVRVQNDGTIDLLLATRSSASAGSPWEAERGTPFDPIEGPQAAVWARWAAAPAPEPSENGGLLRDYVELLVLDYLSANVARRTAMLSWQRSLVLVDNASAFPARVDRPLLDRLLRRLRACTRFPKGLRDALRAFDRTAAQRTFNAGGFEGWLLSPRTLVELDERRAALLTLVEARIAERGAEAVLTL